MPHFISGMQKAYKNQDQEKEENYTSSTKCKISSETRQNLLKMMMIYQQ
jgi:hypothetical protein